MPWNPAGSLALPVGQADSGSSSPVVLAEDQEAILAEIERAVSAIAGAKGIAADLRVTATVTTVSAVAACNVNAMGVSQFSTNPSTANWANQTAIQGFVNNIGRS